jgi:uncharacterized protein
VTDAPPDPPDLPEPPGFLPGEGDEHGLRRMLWVVGVVFVVGALAFLARGADGPADPFLETGAAGPDAGAAPTAEPAPPEGRQPPGEGDLELFGAIAMAVTPPDGEPVGYCALLADTREARAQGLMHRTDMAGYDAMVFAYDEPTAGSFYMFNTVMPLSIAFYDGDGAYISEADMDPCPHDEPGACPTHPAAAPFLHAVEVPQGQLAAMGMVPGSRLEVGGACPAAAPPGDDAPAGDAAPAPEPEPEPEAPAPAPAEQALPVTGGGPLWAPALPATR